MYGLAEHTDRLEAGAIPVIVEGPLDALAVSLASPGHVGVAPLGTALTDSQADSLSPYLRPGDGSDAVAGPIVATDADLAGQMAAERDYWMLTARGAEPRHLAFPAGHDPASLLQQDGRTALADRLTTATSPLAELLVEERLSHLQAGAALPAAAAVVAAGQADRWTARTRDLARRLHVPLGVALTELVRQISRWDGDRHTASDEHIHGVQQVRDRTTSQDQLPPMQRWAPLLRQVDPRLVRDDSWAPLAAAVDQAHRAGHDVPADLTRALSQGPLDRDDPGSDLKWRLLADLDPEPTDWHAILRAQASYRAVPARRPVLPPNPGPTQPDHKRSPER